MKKATRFWVIFDTCTVPQYYQDVHNLLALPTDATMRYDYRKKYLSDDAIKLASGSEERPILFVYAQKDAAYQRKGTSVKFPPEETVRTLWVATRIGRMLNVTLDADKYYFDFQVESYPLQDQNYLDRILGPLMAANEVPWTTWVSVSDRIDSFNNLKTGDEQSKWVALVDALGAHPMQFSEDAFWRLQGPFKDTEGTLVKPKLVRLRQFGKIRQVFSYYQMIENKTWWFEIISDIPRAAAHDRRQLYRVECQTTDEKAVKLSGSPTFDLRRYTAQRLEYQSQSVPAFRSSSADLKLATQPSPGDWPTGPNIGIRHKVRKSYWRVTVGVVFGIIGLIAFGLGASRLFENDTLNGAVLTVGGALLLVAARFILSGKLEFKS